MSAHGQTADEVIAIATLYGKIALGTQKYPIVEKRLFYFPRQKAHCTKKPPAPKDRRLPLAPRACLKRPTRKSFPSPIPRKSVILFPMKRKSELPECPVATTVRLIGSKWKLLIVRNLIERTLRNCSKPQAHASRLQGKK